MRILISVKELIEKGLWGTVCETKGYNCYGLSEGQIQEDDEIELTLEEARELGLLKENN